MRRGPHPYVGLALANLADREPDREEILDRCAGAEEDAARDGVTVQYVLDVNAFRALRWLYPELTE